MYRFLVIGLLTLVGCHSTPELEGFSTEEWDKATLCSEERNKLAHKLEQQEHKLLGKVQTDIEALLGVAPRHELSSRNEKFFYYPINKNCDKPAQSLLVRFDALGRVKEVLVVLD